MRKSFLLLSAILPTALLAQSVELQVIDERSLPMPYAFILINNRGVAVTDTLGYATIDVSEYSPIDTIKASYLSTSGSSVLIGEVLDRGGRYTFTLHQKFVELNPVTITASKENARNKFFRETNITPWLSHDCICQGDFTYSLYGIASVRHVSGQFTATKINREKGIIPTFSGPLEVSTKSDTTGLKIKLVSTVLNTLSISNFLIGAIYSKRQLIIPLYTYLGESGGIRQFRIVYKDGYGGMYYQIIAHIDSKTKDLITYDCDIMKTDECSYSMISIHCETERFVHKQPKLPAVLVPRSIRHNIVLRDSTRVDIETDNMVYCYIKAKRK